MKLLPLLLIPKEKRSAAYFKAAVFLLVAIYAATYPLAGRMKSLYRNQESAVFLDRNGEILGIEPNEKEHYARFTDSSAPRLAELLIRKEDRFFRYHQGINPVSIARDLYGYLTRGRIGGSSTLTQQLAKNILGNENERTLKNKTLETIYALSLELHLSKSEILNMYLNTAYFGSRSQGIKEASEYFFGRVPETLADTQALELLVALNSPSERAPGTAKSLVFAKKLAKRLGVSGEDWDEKALGDKNQRKSSALFEIKDLKPPCAKNCIFTIDKSLTDQLRTMLRRNLNSPSFDGVDNGAIVVIKINRDEPYNELLSFIGSPDPLLDEEGYQINMALKPRPAGSTIKPFIYTKAFEKGARPYTLVEDKEYKYTIGTGFDFYPKNFDGKYRGWVTLHNALSNSLNVPSVKTLEYAGLEEFFDFMKNKLGFRSIRPLESYSLGIVLGGLETDLLTLTNYFTLFPNSGTLKPLKLVNEGTEKPYAAPPLTAAIYSPSRIFERAFVALTNKILSDKESRIEQFGMKSNLSLPAANYAVKTGTSRDFHDSWTIGYTPNFVVGVWLGNADNKAMPQVSGQSGAGKVWHEAMEFMLNSAYNQKTDFDFSAIEEFVESGSIEYGLKGDDYKKGRYIMAASNSVITHPHHGDTFLFEENTTIPLLSEKEVSWYINGAYFGAGKILTWQPVGAGIYKISARDKTGNRQEIEIIINNER